MSSNFVHHGPAELAGTVLDARIWRRDEIEAEIARLLEMDLGARRTVKFLNPQLGAAGGATPGIDVSLNALRAGEETRTHRHTSSVINFVKSGHGHSIIGGTRIEWGPGDVFTTPGWTPHQHVAHGSEPAVRLAYSNAPLLRSLGILMEAEAQDGEELPDHEYAAWDPDAGIRLADTGVRLLSYEQLLKPAWHPVRSRQWAWTDVRAILEPMDDWRPSIPWSSCGAPL